MTEINYRH